MNPALIDKWTDELRDSYRALEGCLNDALDAAIDLGRRLANARDSMGYQTFRRLFQNQPDSVANPLPFTLQWARALIRIAENEGLRQHAARLPSAVATLAALSSISAEQIKDSVEAGLITKGTTQHEALELRHQLVGRSRKIVGDDKIVQRFRFALATRVFVLLRDRPQLAEAVVTALRHVASNIESKGMAHQQGAGRTA